MALRVAQPLHQLDLKSFVRSSNDPKVVQGFTRLDGYGSSRSRLQVGICMAPHRPGKVAAGSFSTSGSGDLSSRHSALFGRSKLVILDRRSSHMRLGKKRNSSGMAVSADADVDEGNSLTLSTEPTYEELKRALAELEEKNRALEVEKQEALGQLKAAENKAEDFAASIAATTEEAMAEMETTKLNFQADLATSQRERDDVADQLTAARQEALELAVKVERMAEIAVQEATARIAEEAKLQIAAAQTAAADATLEVEERIRRAADEAASSVIAEAKATIEDALHAAEIAKQQAQAAEATLKQRMEAFDELAEAEIKLVATEEKIAALERALRLAQEKVERFQIQVRAADARVEAAEAQAAAAEALVLEIQESSEKAAEVREEQTKKAIEAIKVAAGVRAEAASLSFDAERATLRAQAKAAAKGEQVKEQALMRRCLALERSLVAAEASKKAWEERCIAVENLLRAVKEKGFDVLREAGEVEEVLCSGRLEALLGSQQRKWELLANGPRHVHPWASIRRTTGGIPIPPRQKEMPALSLALDLPDVEDVLDLASFMGDFAPPRAPVVVPVTVAPATVAPPTTAPVPMGPPPMPEPPIVAPEVVQERMALERAFEQPMATEPKQQGGVRVPLKRLKAADSEDKWESGTGNGREIVFQGFNWESWRRKWYLEMAPKATDLAKSGFTTIWLPPPTQSVAPQGYLPGDLYNLNSSYGTEDELRFCIDEMHKHDIQVLGDVVLNHRCASKQSPNGIWNIFGGKMSWGPEAIVSDDPNFQGRGNKSSGDIFHAAPNVDHSQDFVRRDIKEWLQWLRNDIGYDGWRLDFVRGFWGGFVKEYIESSNPNFAIGEYWDSLAYEGGAVAYNQDGHRQRIINWINATGGMSSAFDVTTKGILHSALHNEYWRLIDPHGKPPGVMGWWPSRAITFLENHDTGSTQAHWPFPRDKLTQGYAYILTHPGTPVVFYDHFYEMGVREPIVELIAARNRTNVHCRSPVRIFQAAAAGYAAQIGERLCVKLGPLDWNPSKQNNLMGRWDKFVDKGNEYQLWELKG